MLPLTSSQAQRFMIFGMSQSLRFSQCKVGCGERADGLILHLASHQALLQPAHWPQRAESHSSSSSRASHTHRRLPLARGRGGCSYLRDWRMAFMKQVLPRLRRPVAQCARVPSCVGTFQKNYGTSTHLKKVCIHNLN